MKVLHDFNLKPYNSYRVEAIARTVWFPEGKEDLITLFANASIKNKVVIGGGYNLVLSKAYYPDINFVIIQDNYGKLAVEGNKIVAEAGADLKAMSELAYEHSLSGLEYFYDIPGTFGGALVMNAGSKGEDIGNLVDQVSYYDIKQQQIGYIDGASLGSSYRQSIFQGNANLVILEATLALTEGHQEAIYQKMMENKQARWEKQPRDLPNAGSVFKRPPGHYVGKLIEDLGLKGFAVGGARISEKHAGFIVNYDNATGNDIVELIAFIKKRVLEAYQVDLEVEQRII